VVIYIVSGYIRFGQNFCLIYELNMSSVKTVDEVDTDIIWNHWWMCHLLTCVVLC